MRWVTQGVCLFWLHAEPTEEDQQERPGAQGAGWILLEPRYKLIILPDHHKLNQLISLVDVTTWIMSIFLTFFTNSLTSSSMLLYSGGGWKTFFTGTGGRHAGTVLFLWTFSCFFQFLLMWKRPFPNLPLVALARAMAGVGSADKALMEKGDWIWKWKDFSWKHFSKCYLGVCGQSLGHGCSGVGGLLGLALGGVLSHWLRARHLEITTWSANTTIIIIDMTRISRQRIGHCQDHNPVGVGVKDITPFFSCSAVILGWSSIQNICQE